MLSDFCSLPPGLHPSFVYLINASLLVLYCCVLYLSLCDGISEVIGYPHSSVSPVTPVTAERRRLVITWEWERIPQWKMLSVAPSFQSRDLALTAFGALKVARARRVYTYYTHRYACSRRQGATCSSSSLLAAHVASPPPVMGIMKSGLGLFRLWCIRKFIPTSRRWTLKTHLFKT